MNFIDPDSDCSAAQSRRSATKNRPLLVGIGASAGGLDAIIRFLQSVPGDCETSFAVVQHLDPTHEGALETILSRKTELKVQQVEDATPVESHHVYIIPPGKYLAVREGVLRLDEPTELPGSRMAIDYFFRSLAAEFAELAIGVIFSGRGTDGTAGLRDIKECGGIAIAQDPDEAEHAEMPRSAVDSNTVDWVLPVAEISRQLLRYIQHAREHGQVQAKASMGTGDDIEPIIELLRQATQQDFRRYRRNTLTRRILRRMGIHQLRDVSDYLLLLKDSKQEQQQLRCDLLIGVTRFFRNPKAWEKLNEHFIRPLTASESDDPIRIWCAGCATGEEAYSIAIMLQEALGANGGSNRVQVFATDVAADALEVARAGYYPAAITTDVSTARLRRFFKKEGELYRVTRSLRESIVFAEQNVLSHPPFTKLDLILCRNLMIYLETEAQRRVMEVFRFALKEGGGLFLGSSESVRSGSEAFRTIVKKHRLFRRTGTIAEPPVVDREANQMKRPKDAAPESRDARPRGLAALVQRQLLQELEEGIVVVNHEDRVTHLQGRTDLYLELRVGDVVAELPLLFELAREGLRSSTHSLIKAVRRARTQHTGSSRVRRDGSYHRVDIVVRPLRGSDSSLLITFRPQATPTTEEVDAQPDGGDRLSKSPFNDNEQAQLHIRELEQELSTTRQQLYSTIEDLETANEELKASNEESMAMNEELHSGNEELETSKEELQSLNAELTSLNNQLEIRLQELTETTDDLNNLLVSASLPTVFVDSGMLLRRFTPSSRRLFNLIDADIGRPLDDVRAQFDTKRLFKDIEQVLEDLQPREREVTTASGECYIARTLPYRTEDNRIQGAVLTFSDVTKLRRSKREAQDRLAVLRSIYAATPIGLGFVDNELRYQNVSQVLADIDGVPAEESIGKRLDEILPKPLFDKVSPIYQEVLSTSEPVINREIVGQTAADNQPRIYNASYHPVRSGDDGEAIGVSVVVQDVTDERSYQEQLAASEKRFRSTFENAAVGIAHVSLDGRWLRVNNRLCEIFGYAEDELSSRTFQQLTHPDDLRDDLKFVQEMIDGKRHSYSMEKRYIRDDGSTVWGLLTVSLVHTDQGEPDYFISVIEDISARREIENELRESELRFRQLASVTEHVFWITQVEPEKVLYVSSAYERIWGRPAIDLKKDPRLWIEAIHENDRKKVRESFERFVADPKHQRFDCEYRVIRPDGKVRWITDRGDAIFDSAGNIERVAGIARDITEKKRAEIDLHTARLRIEALLRNAPSAMGLIEIPPDDSDVYLLLGNTVTDQVFGVGPGETSGKWARGDLGVNQKPLREWIEKARSSQRVSDAVSFEQKLDPGPSDEQSRERWISVSVSHVGTGIDGREQFCYVATDVTDRKRYEIELADRETQVRRIIDNQLSFVGVLDGEGTLIEVNATAIRAGGVDREGQLGKKFWECYWWCYDQEVAGQLREAVESALSGKVVRYDVPVRMANDSRMIIDFMLVPVCDDDGKITHVIPSGIDITERKAAEEGLRRSRDAFLSLVERMPFGLYVLDSNLRLLKLSEGAREAFDSIDDPIGKGLEEIMRTLWPPQLADELIKRFRKALETGEPYRGYVDAAPRANVDRVESYDWQIYRIGLPEGGYGVVCYFYDVTSLKETERALRRSETQLRLATNVSGIGVLMVDFQDDTVQVDQVAAKYYDLDANRKVRLDELYERIHPDDLRGSDKEAWDRAVESGEDFEIAFEHRVVDRAGNIRWLEVRERAFGKPDYSGKWRLRTAIAAAVDITDRRRFETSLIEARDAADAANRSRGEFLANMSHEIRTPMAAVLGHADMLLDHLKDPDNVDAVKTIKRNGAHLLGVINDILDLSKIEAGKFEIERERCELATLLDDIAALKEIKARNRPVEFHIRSEGKLPRTISTDPTRLKQILFNLVGNALKFTSEGWVELSIALINGDSSKPALRFSVKDTGIGISDQKIETLFEPFSQADPSVTRQFGGTGLGLAISRRLAELLGAELKATSVLGKGSTFTLIVPIGMVSPNALIDLKINERGDRSPTPSSTITPTLNCRLLLVDDRRDIRYVAQHFLEEAGADVTTAEDGEQGIEKVKVAGEQKTPYDLVVMDMQMPVVDGYTAVRRLREAGYTMPIVALTANAMKEDRDKCLEAGCDDYLPKPIDAEKLVAIVQKLVSGDQLCE